MQGGARIVNPAGWGRNGREREGTSSMLCWRARVRSSCLARALPCLSRWICVYSVSGGASAKKEQEKVVVDLADSCREPGVVCAHEICCVHTGVLAFEVGEGEVEVHLPPTVRKPSLVEYRQLWRHREYLERIIGIGFEMIEDNLGFCTSFHQVAVGCSPNNLDKYQWWWSYSY